MQEGVTRLDVLLHARELAEKVGAVKDGSHLFETRRPMGPLRGHQTVTRFYDPNKVCGVCIVGAITLAAIALDAPYAETQTMSELTNAAQVAIDSGVFDEWWAGCSVSTPVHGLPLKGWTAVSDAITKHGTPYVLAVLDAMIAQEKALVDERVEELTEA